MSQYDTEMTDQAHIHGNGKPGISNLTDLSNSFTVTEAGDSVSETESNTVTDTDTEESDIDSSSADCELMASESDSELCLSLCHMTELPS